jgi:hypothetical protein
MNFSIIVVNGKIEKKENRNEIYIFFLNVTLQLLRNTLNEDESSKMRLIIALGNFVYDSNVRRKLVSSEIQKYIVKCKQQTNGLELQAAAAETLNEILKV